jgi:hypothetical protein
MPLLLDREVDGLDCTSILEIMIRNASKCPICHSEVDIASYLATAPRTAPYLYTTLCRA